MLALKNHRMLGKLLTSNVRRSKMIAIALRSSGAVIAHATNKVVLGHARKFTNHAEEELIKKLLKIKAKERFGDITVLVMRWSRIKKWSMARPCAECLSQLTKYGVSEIIYTDEKGHLKVL